MSTADVKSLIAGMTLEERIGQLLMAACFSQRQAEVEIERYKVGGFVCFYEDALSLAKRISHLQQISPIPLLVGADFERGTGAKIDGGTDLVTQMGLGATRDPNLCFDVAALTAEEARLLGVNVNFMPVLDVNTNPSNPIINVRAFGEHPALVGELGRAYIKGTQSRNVLAVAKHFPGHGDTRTDTHLRLALVNWVEDEIRDVALPPFQEAIDAGVDGIMPGHLRIPAFEQQPIPATMSRRILQGLLRDEMGFKGLIFSDAMEMGGIVQHFSFEEAVERVFGAGCDLLVMLRDNEEAVDVLRNAVKKGRISEERLNESAARILAAKAKLGLFDQRKVDVEVLPQRLNSPNAQATAHRAALAGITLVKNTEALIPLKPDAKVAVITLSNYEASKSHWKNVVNFPYELMRFVPRVKLLYVGMADDPTRVRRAVELARNADVVLVAAFIKVIVGLGKIRPNKRMRQCVAALRETGKPMGMVSFGSPYVLRDLPWIGGYIAAYGDSLATQQAAAELVAGTQSFRGVLPVTITEKYPEGFGIRE
jgi:beta-N-acetylhexosaminidase